MNSLIPDLAELLFFRAPQPGAMAHRACQSDWQKARSRYAHPPPLGDELLIALFDATNKFFKGPQARAAFSGGWTAAELFGITLEKPRRFGAICASVYAAVDIVRFDGPWVWIHTPAIDEEDEGASISRLIRTDYRFRRTVPWWRHPSPVR